jgi:hypothetical protein
VLCSSAKQEADRLGVLAVFNKDHLVSSNPALFHKAGLTEVALFEVVDLGGDAGAGGA